MYNYDEIKPRLFDDEGQRLFLKIRDKAQELLKVAGAFRMQECLSHSERDTWTLLACVDRLVELGEIRELTIEHHVAGQDRVFVKAN